MVFQEHGASQYHLRVFLRVPLRIVSGATNLAQLRLHWPSTGLTPSLPVARRPSTCLQSVHCFPTSQSHQTHWGPCWTKRILPPATALFMVCGHEQSGFGAQFIRLLSHHFSGFWSRLVWPLDSHLTRRLSKTSKMQPLIILISMFQHQQQSPPSLPVMKQNPLYIQPMWWKAEVQSRGTWATPAA